MTVDERKEALETVLDEVAGRAAVIAHIGAFRTDETVALARHAGEAGADAIPAPAGELKPAAEAEPAQPQET